MFLERKFEITQKYFSLEIKILTDASIISNYSIIVYKTEI